MIEQGSEAWLQLRLGKVTASRVADIMAKTKTGVSASRGNYLIELALQRLTGTVEQGYTNDAMAWGTATEPQARVAYEVKTGNFVDQIAFVEHEIIEWFGCSPDGLIDKDGMIEIKCPNSATHWATIKDNKIPSKYMIQMQTQMACTGRKWCDFVSFDPRMPERSQLFIKRAERDQTMIDEIETEVMQFLIEVFDEVKLMRGS
jgi:putative phage-type endonuclease